MADNFDFSQVNKDIQSKYEEAKAITEQIAAEKREHNKRVRALRMLEAANEALERAKMTQADWEKIRPTLGLNSVPSSPNYDSDEDVYRSSRRR
jgi:uncharacterized protein YbcC (UPF0753/DUF2309 family)